MNARRARRIGPLLFLLPAVVYLVVFFGYPIVNNVVMGFQRFTGASFATGVAPWAGLENYRTIVSSAVFVPALVNTLLFTVGSIVGQFGIGMAFALFFRRGSSLNRLLRSLILLPWLLPMIVTSAAWRSLMDKDSGVLNQFLAGFGVDPVPWLTSPNVALISVILVNIWIGIPFNATILHSGLQDIPADIYEAASLDGAGAWATFWRITLPNLRGVVSVVLVLGVVYTLKALDIILGLTGGGPANATQTLSVQSYLQSFQSFDFGAGAAYSNILVIISLAFALAYLRLNRGADNG